MVTTRSHIRQTLRRHGYDAGVRSIARAAVGIVSAFFVTACGADGSETKPMGAQLNAVDLPRFEYVTRVCDVDNVGGYDGVAMTIDQGNAVEGIGCILLALNLRSVNSGLEEWDEQPKQGASGSFERNGVEVSWTRDAPQSEVLYPVIVLRDMEDLSMTEHRMKYDPTYP